MNPLPNPRAVWTLLSHFHSLLPECVCVCVSLVKCHGYRGEEDDAYTGVFFPPPQDPRPPCSLLSGPGGLKWTGVCTRSGAFCLLLHLCVFFGAQCNHSSNLSARNLCVGDIKVLISAATQRQCHRRHVDSSSINPLSLHVCVCWCLCVFVRVENERYAGEAKPRSSSSSSSLLCAADVARVRKK